MRSVSLILLTLAFLGLCLAQLGPDITSPANNATVDPGKKVTIDFQYQNLGTGTYTVDIALWQDARGESKIQDVVQGYSLPNADSSGVTVPFYYNGSYDWWVPHGMNFSFYLSVTEHAYTQAAGNITVTSQYLMLHPSSAWSMLPNTLFALCISSFTLYLLS
ncbi:hypothetical protein DM01DRAFT_1342406 [Hesseltinella vesiculosa]|uniref:Translocon-associated protein subunit beta n=1 Tax=Hesseltinella vesiculosa TaxID=101127 RepID=A0A1X2GTT6_9FUNG|nr:hypothetical protein DM01DRAFT_1342406 [Hesseltinella vesiculosa]